MIGSRYEHDTCENYANRICRNNLLNRSDYYVIYLFDLILNASAASSFKNSIAGPVNCVSKFHTEGLGSKPICGAFLFCYDLHFYLSIYYYISHTYTFLFFKYSEKHSKMETYLMHLSLIFCFSNLCILLESVRVSSLLKITLYHHS